MSEIGAEDMEIPTWKTVTVRAYHSGARAPSSNDVYISKYLGDEIIFERM
jgi:hypothetical protein